MWESALTNLEDFLGQLSERQGVAYLLYSLFFFLPLSSYMYMVSVHSHTCLLHMHMVSDLRE